METKNPHAVEGAGASDVLGRNVEASSTATTRKATLSAFVDPRHSIVIRSVGGLFQVTIEPEHPAHQPETFSDHRHARGFAGGLRLVNRWQIVDETMEARHG
jgi:hypothetical protein